MNDIRPRAGSAMSPPDPVFVGGTGRSGTTIAAQLVGKHSQYAYIPAEVSFHAQPDGLPGLLDGEVELEDFLEMMRGRWFEPSRLPGRRSKRGIAQIVDRDVLEQSLQAFGEAFESDRLAACRTLIRSLLDPVAGAAGKPSWVEMTPRNATAAPVLHQLFPQMKLIHMTRDGRDVAAGKLGQDGFAGLAEREGLVTLDEAIIWWIEWWVERLQKIENRCRELPPGSVLTLRIEDLAAWDRNRSFARLLSFLSLDAERRMWRFFDRQVTREGALIDLWRQELTGEQVERVEQAYRDGLAKVPWLDSPEVVTGSRS